jgi:putative ABC transport system permease protein
VRTAITLAAIVFGVAGLIVSGGFVRDMFVQLGEALIHSQSGHLQVARAGYFERGSGAPEKYRLDDAQTLRRTIASTPGVTDVLARVHFSGLLGNGRTDWPIVGEGVEPGKESRLGTQLRLIDGRALTDRDTFGIMLGQGVADVLHLRPGDRATLLVNTAEGALNTLDFDVVGVFQTFSRDFDARAVRLHRAAARELLASEGVNVLVVSLGDTDDTARAAAALRERLAGQPLEVGTWKELNDFYDKTVTLYDRLFGVLQAITLAMVLLGVANSVNLSVFERVGEFGTMRALGNRRRDVFRLIVTESALLGLIGSALGVAVGVALALAISAVGIAMPPPPNANLGYDAYIRIVPDVLATAFAIGVVATTLAALLPAARATRTAVVDALRANI